MSKELQKQKLEPFITRTKFELPEIAHFDLQGAKEKPWRDGEQSAFFNHGFNEETFIEFQQRLKNMQFDMVRYCKKKGPEYFQQKHIQHKVLDFYTPVEYGGFGAPIDRKRTEHVNFLPKDGDLQEIKYRTVGTNKNEFFVPIPEKTGRSCDYSHVKKQHRFDEKDQKEFERSQRKRKSASRERKRSDSKKRTEGRERERDYETVRKKIQEYGSGIVLEVEYRKRRVVA